MRSMRCRFSGKDLQHGALFFCANPFTGVNFFLMDDDIISESNNYGAAGHVWSGCTTVYGPIGTN